MKIKFTTTTNTVTCETIMHICHPKSSVCHQLFEYLHKQAYHQPYRATWVAQSLTVRALRMPSVNLTHMAHSLREQDWKIYYWRDRIEDEDDYVLNGGPEGLIVGKYCVNMLAWQLSYT
jgi:hypothetical protein